MCALIAFAFALTAHLAATAASAPLVVIVRDDDTRPFVAATEGASRDAARSRTIDVDDAALDETIRGLPSALVVALGPRAAARVALLRSRGAAAALVRGSDAPTTLAVVDLELSREAAARLVARAFPGRTRVLVPRRAGLPDDGLRAACASARLTCEVLDVAAPSETAFVVERALRGERHAALVWLLPDPGVVSSESVPALVEIGIQARVPLVGFSTSFVKAGAAGAFATDFARMGEAARALAESSLDETAPRARIDPPGARLVVNGRLCEKLGVAIGRGDGVEVER